ncbi:D-alanyl-D-alanine carboxypeptidase/D-alanyl-D-alanine-endopeptidase [Ideonella sp. A 288]|uniref:D-alanyl-D-alanine carboxypeptidase/D-alanyl-D-alanine endopeptidase n=1 Tax=Ideonella sp. A 288 TaxID=1962181 RepID=UPI0013034DD9|nr:D-alanyl-D-alanine carboxypeptidase/D-alanyl-D-alanine-endopeptidase [Ideonella sp. A 288]
MRCPTSTRGRAGRGLIAALLCLCAASTAVRAGPLPAPVQQALRAADLPDEALAVVVRPVGRGRARLAWQADRAMQPGSTMKVVTTAVALDRLGPNHRGFTELLSAAPVQGDVLRGDLVLRGGADPELGLPQLWALLSELRWQGVREIAGDIVLDRSLFRPARLDLGVPPFDEWPESRYNVIPDALHLTESLMGFELDSTAADGTVRARLVPPLPGVRIDTSRMTPSTRPCRQWDEDWLTPAEQATDADGTLRLTLRSGFPAGCVRREALQLIDRDQLAERHLRWLWQGLGGTWQGKVRAEPGPAAARVLVRRPSRPWGELLRHLNKTSDNAWTRLLYLQLGVPAMAAEPDRSTAELAAREVLRWFDEQRIATAGLVLDNGSGLSRSERISPHQMAAVLAAARAGRWASELTMSLPVPGVDGTLAERLKGSPAAGRARLKTGTLRNVVALAGYVPDAQGRWWILAAMVNHDQAGRARPVLDALVDWVAQGGAAQGGGPRRSPVGPQGEGP